MEERTKELLKELRELEKKYKELLKKLKTA